MLQSGQLQVSIYSAIIVVDMKRVVLISDNHSLKEPLEYVREKYSDYDYFLHCGDSELPKYLLGGFAAVCGNNDRYGEFPQNLVISIGDHQVYVTHGHRDFFMGKLEMLASSAKAKGCDIACFGHTHVPFDGTIDGVRLLNPGSAWHNRDGSPASYMLLTFDGGRVDAQLMRIPKNGIF